MKSTQGAWGVYQLPTKLSSDENSILFPITQTIPDWQEEAQLTVYALAGAESFHKIHRNRFILTLRGSLTLETLLSTGENFSTSLSSDQFLSTGCQSFRMTNTDPECTWALIVEYDLMTSQQEQPRVRSAEEFNIFHPIPNLQVRRLTSALGDQKQMSVDQFSVNGDLSMHYHQHSSAIIVGSRGQGSFHRGLNDTLETFALSPGQIIVVPRNTPHGGSGEYTAYSIQMPPIEDDTLIV